MKKLDNTDIGELEFQLTYYIGYTCKVIAHTDYMFDVIITNYKINRVIFMIVLELSYNSSLLLRRIYRLYEQKDITDLESRIYKALQVFELMWVGIL